MDFSDLPPRIPDRHNVAAGVERCGAGGCLFAPEPQRVVLRPFVPAENGRDRPHGTRIEHILDRVLMLAPADCDRELDHVLQSLCARHRDVDAMLGRRFDDIAGPHLYGRSVSAGQRLLCGAY
ncbi:MAG TPA: hypothetical protein VF409_05440, partial [Sphingomonas sp.]